MAKHKPKPPAPPAPPVHQGELESDTRVDATARHAFEILGYQGRLPDSLVKVYGEFKQRKDALQAGSLTPEGFACVDMLAALHDRRLKL